MYTTSESENQKERRIKKKIEWIRTVRGKKGVHVEHFAIMIEKSQLFSARVKEKG